MSWCPTERSARGILLALLLGGCDDPPEDADARAAEVLWTGCASYVGPSTCEVGDAPLRLWVPGDAIGWTWTLDQEPLLPVSQVAVDGGLQVQLDIPPDVSAELALVHGRGRKAFSLSLEPFALDPDRFSWGAAYRARVAEGDMDGRRALADTLAGAVEDDASIEALAQLHHATKLRLNRGDPADDVAEVRALLTRTRRVAEDLGRRGEACEALKLQVFLDTAVSASGGEASWRDSVDACAELAPAVAAKFDYYVGVHALRRGRYAEAEARLKRARAFAERTDDVFVLPTRQRLLELFVDTGRWREARTELDALEDAEASGCRRGMMDADLGSVRVSVRLRRDGDLGDPRPALQRALEVHAPGGGCESTLLYHHDLIELAYADALDGDAHALGERLKVLDAAALYEKYPLERAELHVYEALLTGAAANAQRALDAMEAEMVEGTEPEARWRHHMLRARLAVLRGDSAAEIEAYRAAEGVLDRLWQRVRSGAVREQWFGSYHSSAQQLMEALVAAGDPEAAACAVRRARSRALERTPNAAVPTCDRPWARHEGELVVLVVPNGTGAWRVFAVEDERVVDTRTVAAAEAGDDDSTWWNPWAPQLQRATAVRILAGRGALEVPLHHLGWDGRPLGTRRPVTWGLDLASPPLQGPSADALVVFSDADPLRTLTRYEDAVVATSSRLDAEGWTTTYLGGRVDLAGLSARLPAGGLLHYYGHGLLDEESVAAHQGDLGTTALLLADGTRLGVGDVASAPAVPRRVVLLGCDVGFSDGNGWNGGLNLVHAFLLRGADEVLASSAPIRASHAAELGAFLYDDQTPETIDLSEALHTAWQEDASMRSALLWKDLRVWTP